MPFLLFPDVKTVLPISVIDLALLSLLIFAAVPTFRLIQHLMHPSFSALKILRGPKPSSSIHGNLKEIPQADNGVWHERMAEEYGHVMVYRGLLGSRKLFTMDPKAIGHVLNNTAVYQRTKVVRWILEPIFGHGLLFVEDDIHRRQRRVMNPSFNTAHIREMTDVFISKSQEMRDILLSALPDNTRGPTTIKVNIADYLMKATLDMIGLAGFNYSFNALKGQRNEFSNSFTILSGYLKDLRFSTNKFVFQLLKGYFPALRSINLDQRSKDAAIAKRLILETANLVVEEGKKKFAQAQADTGDDGTKKGKDLLSLMLKVNVDGSREAVNTLSEEELAHQVSTFLLAGHETTANSASWALFSLATHPEMQTRLRNELRSLDLDFPTMEQLNSLPYLDAVVHETLRCHPIVGNQERAVIRDDIIPVETSYLDRWGKTRNHIPISKGDTVLIPILLMNTSKEIWGEDAKEFNPDRWQSPPKLSQSIPGVWGNILTFLGGPHACIGFKFSVIELKALLFVLVKAFEFDLAEPVENFYNGVSIIKRPVLKSDPHGEPQLPMFIKRASSLL